MDNMYLKYYYAKNKYFQLIPFFTYSFLAIFYFVISRRNYFILLFYL